MSPSVIVTVASPSNVITGATSSTSYCPQTFGCVTTVTPGENPEFAVVVEYPKSPVIFVRNVVFNPVATVVQLFVSNIQFSGLGPVKVFARKSTPIPSTTPLLSCKIICCVTGVP